MSNLHINNARHSTNCLCSLKTWATEEDCDCQLGELKRRIQELKQAIAELLPRIVDDGALNPESDFERAVAQVIKVYNKDESVN